ncbi:tRNA-modifying enzyme [Salinivirga cyanobacteriivorans]|uniref:tRNA-modifying enzyme n=1 Tax=Salinivirga cyanobacteriivorans TaxID=1307839 RepID=A0A0S2I4S3_9BACT|nr:anaerobic ribonucleoside-triphosphate reductase activating protein [Salinivirga cyanobacteriivorans]ALO17350.1 tRNA-modifying enzyme [Salinivirga cyanobacteriivorans]
MSGPKGFKRSTPPLLCWEFCAKAFHDLPECDEYDQSTIVKNLKIGGFTKQSFIDWKGRTCAVVFTKGCNFRCSYCHNPSLVLKNQIKKMPDIDPDEILDYLKSRKDWLDGVVVTGGEPTLHIGLPEFLCKIKSLGLAVKLDTNGSNPCLLKELIAHELVDYVAMDIKTCLKKEAYNEITNCSDQNLIEKIQQSLEVLRSSGIDYQLRTTALPGHHTEAVMNELKQQFGGEHYVVQKFREGDVLGKYED